MSTDADAMDPADHGFDSSVRAFRIEGDVWLARLAGGSAAGSGAFGLAYIESIEFASAAAPESPVREVLIQRGRFELLHDEELVALFRGAPPLTKRRSLEDMH